MENQYSKEYRLYMEYALVLFLTEKYGLAETEARWKVSQEYEEVLSEAKRDKYV